MNDGFSRRSFLKLTGAGLAAAAVAQAAPQSADAHEFVPGLFDVVARPTTATPDAQTAVFLRELAALEAPKLTDLTPFNGRQTNPVQQAALAVLTQQGKPAQQGVGNVAHRLIPGGAGQQLLIRIYEPAGSGPFPALVYFHGGGFVIANLDVYDASCRSIVNAANCSVISVAYRQAPENRFPAAVYDAYAAYKWVMDNAASIRVDPKRVAVGGESAGGNLATVTAILARDNKIALPVHQLLIYPLATFVSTAPSFAEFVDAQPLNTATAKWFGGYYLRSMADGKNPLASPLFTPSLKGLPSATVITAEIDPLRDDGEAYAARLQAAGVPTVATRYTGVVHEFFGLAGIIDKGMQAVMKAGTELKKAFGR